MAVESGIEQGTAPSVGSRGTRSGRTTSPTPAEIVAARKLEAGTVPSGFGGPTPSDFNPFWTPPGPAEQQVADYTRIYLVDPSTGLESWYYYKDLVAAGIAEPGLTAPEIKAMDTGDMQSRLNELLGGGGGGGGRRGGGGGAAGPVYVKPDERLVREAVKADLVALTGRADAGMVDELVGVYLAESKRAFDLRETEQIDPMETVKGKIRATAEYKAIHQLRPDSADEFDWVSTRIGALRRAGVTDKLAQGLGIEQATVGATAADAATAGNIATFQQSGKLLEELRGRISNSTYSALRLV